MAGFIKYLNDQQVLKYRPNPNQEQRKCICCGDEADDVVDGKFFCKECGDDLYGNNRPGPGSERRFGVTFFGTPAHLSLSPRQRAKMFKTS